MSRDYAVIGTGYWGSNHVRVASELLAEGHIDSLTICDIDEERVADLASNYGVEYTTDYTTLAERGDDAAVVAAPSPTHRTIATELLDAGLDVLVEKPLALSSEDAWAIVDAAAANDRVLATGHIFRYHPALCDLKRRIDRGEFGQIRYLNTTRFAYRAPRSDAGALFSLAVHDVDIYSWLLGRDPERVYCTMDATIREGVDETATLTLSYGEGTTGVINESWNVPVTEKRRDLTVVGTERTAHVDYLQNTELELHDATMVRDGDAIHARQEGSRRHETDAYEPLRAEVEAFLEGCETRTSPSGSGRVGARAVELLERAEESARTGQAVDVSLRARGERSLGTVTEQSD
ncbi:Gfo/Idh/MocA family protein [Halomarina rubra]|uniref:Gfo/Idh/MocA family protein n=1 Tax=Halomarina rubra TaxID=2071873 RepID=A0ABD6B2C6_9EURY|nr:Gfo/Idh/MocA family oxidoreductase [Halomarina rubra]